MQQTKLLNLLKTLTKTEFKEFGKFIKSPYPNARKNPIILYQFIKKYHPKLESRKLTKEYAFLHVFPNDNYNIKRIRNVFSELSLLVEDFLVWKELENIAFKKQQILTEVLSKRSNYALFKKNTEQLLADLEKQEKRGMNYYKLVGALEQNLFFHVNTPKLTIEESGIERAVTALDNYFLIAKLKYSCELLSRQNLLTKEAKILWLEECKHLVENEGQGQNPAANLYYQLIVLIENPLADAQFQKVKKLFELHQNLLNRKEQIEILMRLMNFAIARSNQGESVYSEALFELYQLGLDSKLLFENERITDSTFTNIAILAAILHQFEWVKGFIVNYQNYLEKEFQKEAISLSWAYYYFHKKDFGEADLELRKVSFKNLKYSLRGRVLLLRIHFELLLQKENYLELLNAQILAYEKFLQRNKALSEEKKLAYKNLSSYIKKMALAVDAAPPSAELLEKWRNGIINTPSIIARRWLLDKVKDFQKKVRQQ